MRILSVAAASGRHVVMAIAEGALVTAIAVALVFAGSVVTGSGPAGADQVAAKARAPLTSSSISRNPDSQLWLGGDVTFTSNAVGLTGGEYPMIVVSCSQNGTVVYAQLDHPDATFVLGGGSSQWWVVGGPAGCEATLYAYGGKSKGYDTIRTLAGPITFNAAG